MNLYWMLPPYFRSLPQGIQEYLHTVQFNLYSSTRSSLIQVFFSYLIFFSSRLFIDFEHVYWAVWCWMDCMAPEYLSVCLVIYIWIIYLVQCVLARPTSQSDSDGWLQQRFVSLCPPVPLFFEQCFKFSFFLMYLFCWEPFGIFSLMHAQNSCEVHKRCCNSGFTV